MLVLRKIHPLSWNCFFFFPCPRAIMTFCSWIVFGISETGDVLFDDVYGIFNWRIICFRVIYTFPHLFPNRKNFFCNSHFPLNFNNVKKFEHLLTSEALCNRNIFTEFITRLQISECLVYNVWAVWNKRVLGV